jgi:hypothetical protein
MKKRITFYDIVDLELATKRKNPFFIMLIITGEPLICIDVKYNFYARAPPLNLKKI